MVDAASIVVPLHWLPVRVKESHFNWHKNLPKTVRERDQISGPKVYRWVLRTQTGEIQAVYIGQSEKFQARVSDYRRGDKAGLDLDDTVQARMKRCENCGGTVELQFLDLDAGPFKINGMQVTNSSLADHDIRLMMESIAIVTARAANLPVINRLQENVNVKSLKRLVKANPKLIPQLRQLITQTEKQ